MRPCLRGLSRGADLTRGLTQRRRQLLHAGRPGRRAFRLLLAGWLAVLVPAMAGFAEFSELPGPFRTLAVAAARPGGIAGS